jgi:hypothetical protein
MPNGYLENQPVEIILKEFPKKIAVIYFHYEKITFTDDILLEIGILPNYKIDKPSSNREMAKKYFMDKIKKIKEDDNKQYLGLCSKHKAQKKHKSQRILHNVEINLTRSFVNKKRNQK